MEWKRIFHVEIALETINKTPHSLLVQNVITLYLVWFQLKIPVEKIMNMFSKDSIFSVCSTTNGFPCNLLRCYNAYINVDELKKYIYKLNDSKPCFGRKTKQTKKRVIERHDPGKRYTNREIVKSKANKRAKRACAPN